MKFINWLNGKKTVIGAIAGAVLPWLFASGYMDQNDAALLAVLISAWTGVAVGHKIKKGEFKKAEG